MNTQLLWRSRQYWFVSISSTSENFPELNWPPDEDSLQPKTWD